MKIEVEASTTVFLLSMLSMSIFLALAAWFSISGNTSSLFVSSLGVWLSYLAAHKTAEGKFVDGLEDKGKDPKMTPKNSVEYAGSAVGFLILVVGMGVGSTGLGNWSFPILVVGATLFLTGYVVAHLSTTGELL